MMLREVIRIAVFGCAASLAGCSYLFYQPSKEVLVQNPEVLLNLKTEEHFRSRDGTRLNGWWFKRQKGKEQGLIVFFHGNAQNMTSHFANLFWVTDLGFDLFVFDYRGYGASDGKPSQGGLVEDGVAAIEYAWRRELSLRAGADGPRKFVMYGQSLGGNVLLHSVQRLSPEVRNGISSVVVEGTFLNYKKVAADVLSRIWLLWPFQWLGYVLVENHYDPDLALEKLSPTPLVVIHNRADRVVPFAFGEEIFAKAEAPKFAIWVPGGAHLSAMFQSKGKYRAELFEHLKADAPSAQGACTIAKTS